MKARQLRLAFTTLCVMAFLTSGCIFSLRELPTLPLATPANLSAPTMLPKAQSVFIATVPEPLADGEALALALLDEVTGLALNAELYPMQASDPLTYSATLALPHRAVVKYRYVRLGTAQVTEDDSLDLPIRYRLYFAAGPAEVKDVVSGWSDKTVSGQVGSIQGRVLNIDTGAPIPDILVAAAGRRAFTDSAGRFDLQGVGTGTHNLVAYAIDGTFEPFQQGATVAAGLNTAVEIEMKAAPLVRVTFSVATPIDIQGTPVRIAGNLVELGNTFADLQGGLSTLSERMPVMAFQPDGRHSATITLPVGAYVQYKYTLGDGFWNAEHTADGAFRLREFIVPAQDMVIQDAVETWNAGNSSPVLFEVVVPADTPASDIISIQFNPYGWTEPIPMWPLGGGRWLYKLYGPINTLSNLHYRYCRAGQCGSADDLSTAGDAAQGRIVETSLVSQDIKDSVGAWAWLGDTEPSALVGSNIGVRPAGFAAGVEYQAGFQPNWPFYNPQAIQAVQAMGANWVVFTPGWTYSRPTPLIFGVSPQNDPFWLNSTIMISEARAANLSVAIFPVPRFAESESEFWSKATLDSAWWQNWFEHYRAFAVHHADLASQTGSQALILGGDWLSPALPGGKLPDGSNSSVPADAALRWQAILTEVRQHFDGKVWWALPYEPGGAQDTSGILASTDGLYVLWSAPLALEEGASKADMLAEAERLLDSEIAPLAAVTNKPVMLALAYPSARGVRTGCFNDGGVCLPWDALSQPNNPGSVDVDLDAQVDMYEAVLNALNSRPYVGGVISRGFYPPTLLQDKSASVHGKPAADLLWYWFPRLTGAIQ
jgi:hypothetical protein